MNSQEHMNKRRGVALLVVLFIVMAITVLSLGFLSQSDVELACGRNMTLRMQMDYLAESGLEHARGLILSPQDVDSEYWTGAVRQQLLADSEDYYDVGVTKLGECNFQITCDAYGESSGQEVGRSGLRAELRLDPSIALWTGQDTTIWQRVAIDGDVYCNGTLKNVGTINGDAFAVALDGAIAGRQKPVADLSLAWPQVTVVDFTSRYAVQPISSSLSNVVFGPYDPLWVCYHGAGDVELAGNVQIHGMLAVEGNLRVRGSGNVLTAAKNVPALLVTGNLVIENGSVLDIDGLVIVHGQVQVCAGGADVSIVGALFTQDGIVETAMDSSDNANPGTLYNYPTWQPSGGQVGGALEFDGADDRVEVLDAPGFLNGLSAITLSLWVKSDVTNQDRGIMFSCAPNGVDEDLGIRYDNAGAFGHGAKGIKASIRTTSGYTQVESTSNVQTTEWQHLAIVWESGSSLKLYINGVLDPLLYDRGLLSGTLTGIEKLMLGRGAKGCYWDGLIDDVRVYNCVLNPSDIYPPVEGLPGLVGHWKLDEDGAGNVSITAAPLRTAIVIWPLGAAKNWSSAAGAFYRSIERK